ncbi:MAG: UDP-glucose/GDP-mannose dehydrogenase family protein [Candidatus Sericytochromatia bacterium]|nr:UDP-glucose/GDP-mannose dehydrogenase family protein [Candidatus Sericytochromatia bacterium]
MRLAIIGTGYVGLVTAACFAELGHDVVGVDSDAAKIETLRQGRVPFYEPGLEGLVTSNLSEGRLRFTTAIAEATADSEILFICVGTPPLPNGDADLSAVETVMREIASAMDGYRLIVEKSTVPVQTARWLSELAQQYIRPGVAFDLASNPEFLSEGTAVRDFLKPDRVVLGCNSDRAAGLLVQLYAPLNAPLLVTDINSAELIKHASNAFLATKISFINSVATICERTGADIEKVAKGIGLDRRIGPAFLQAGIGYGGICFPKDVASFIQLAAKVDVDFGILKAVAEVNTFQRQHVVDLVREALGGSLAGQTVGVLGLAFKPNTDDIREAPSLTVIAELLAAGATVRAYDPVAMPHTKGIFPGITYADDLYAAVTGVDALVLVTEWEAFRHPDWLRIKQLMRRPSIIDGRNLWEPSKLLHLGFEYRGIGRGTHHPAPAPVRV